MDKFIEQYNYPAKQVYDQNIDSIDKLYSAKNIPFLPIAGFENAKWEKMLKEAKSLSDQYVTHRAKESDGWQSLCIHGLSSVHTDHHSRYGFPDRNNAPYKWTDISNFCPTITRFFKKSFGYNLYDRIRIMKLRPGGYIDLHQDVFDLDEARLGPINIALNNPEDCKFYMEDIGYLPFQQGSVIMLNLYNKHCVYNNSNDDRYHLIVHGKKDKTWPDRLWNSYKLHA